MPRKMKNGVAAPEEVKQPATPPKAAPNAGARGKAARPPSRKAVPAATPPPLPKPPENPLAPLQHELQRDLQCARKALEEAAQLRLEATETQAHLSAIRQQAQEALNELGKKIGL